LVGVDPQRAGAVADVERGDADAQRDAVDADGTGLLAAVGDEVALAADRRDARTTDL